MKLITSQETLDKLRYKDFVELECYQCGIIFNKTKKAISDTRKPNKFCSAKCQTASRDTTKEYKCGSCGVSVFRSNMGVEASGAVYCSRSCAARVNNVNSPKRSLEGKCSVCNKETSKSCKTCKECRQRIYEENNAEDMTINELKAILNHNDFNGRVRYYNRKWNIKYFDNKCSNCKYSIHIEFCHINPVKDFHADTKLNIVNAKENNIVLCRNCHWEFDHGMLVI